VSSSDTGTDPLVADSDGDGCGDGAELGSDRGDGGRRDPTNGWDFYDVPTPALSRGYSGQGRDGGIGVTTDVLALLAYSGRNASQPEYVADYDGSGVEDGLQYDRSLSTTPGEPWRSGPPDGAIGATSDVVAMLAQTGSKCS
ncbi:MAG TPA: flexitail domain-containing putative surface protein, partial [Dehalococcoidia bacterium]|nr:flexitail domain-containing putative surface protein [Dehalococcoidia bacterium]